MSIAFVAVRGRGEYVVDPESLDSYRAAGGYEALARAIEMGADAVLDAVSDAGLSGRGGAAFLEIRGEGHRMPEVVQGFIEQCFARLIEM